MRRFIHSTELMRLVERCGSHGVVALRLNYIDLLAIKREVKSGIFLALYEEPEVPVYLVKALSNIGSRCYPFEAVARMVDGNNVSRLGRAEIPAWELVA